MLQATLTVPGIAGYRADVGMAVDANVLIYERIREELSVGSTPQASIHAGYERAFSSILDANVTTPDCGRGAVLDRQRPGARIRGDPGDRDRDLDVHRC